MSSKPEDSIQSLIQNLARAKSCISASEESVCQVHDLPAREESNGAWSADHYRRLLISMLLLDGPPLIDNIYGLDTDTMMVAEGCGLLAVAKNPGVIASIAQAVVEFNTKAQALSLRFSRALLRRKALGDHIQEEIAKRRAENGPSRAIPERIGKWRGMITRTSMKLRTALSKILTYINRGRRKQVNELNDDGLADDETRDLLVLALALQRLESLFESMRDYVVSIGDYMHIVNKETEKFIAWFLVDLKRINEMVDQITGLQSSLRRLRGCFGEYLLEVMPVPFSEERLLAEFKPLIQEE